MESRYDVVTRARQHFHCELGGIDETVRTSRDLFGFFFDLHMGYFLSHSSQGRIVVNTLRYDLLRDARAIQLNRWFALGFGIGIPAGLVAGMLLL